MTIQFASGAARQANFLSGSSKTWRTVYQSCGRQTVANCIPSPTHSHVFSAASQACYSIASSTTSICTFTQTKLTGMRRSPRTVQLRDAETYQPLHHWLFPREQDDQTLYCVLFSQDGRYLAYGDESRKITLDDPRHRSPACNICSRCYLALTLVLALQASLLILLIGPSHWVDATKPFCTGGADNINTYVDFWVIRVLSRHGTTYD
jgi:hypothetical protein